MYRLLIASLLLAAGCYGDKADPEEIAKVFARHSFAADDPAAVKKAFGSGRASLIMPLDAYAAVLSPGERLVSDYPVKTKAGAGLVLWRTPEGFSAVKVFDGSPAYQAGLRDGDLVVKLDGLNAENAPPASVLAALWGARGGEFRYEAETKEGRALAGTLKREFGGMPLVWSFMVPGSKTGYLRLASFSEGTPAQVKKELEALLRSGARAVIMDLRHSYGGPMGTLAQTLSLFAPGPGALFKAVSRHPGYCRDFAAPKAGPFAGLKLVLLTDSGTVSLAEVFAASLKEAGLAIVAGGNTAGNVSVTKTFRLSRGGALRITVARLVTPSGADLDGRGLAPDLPVADPLDGEYAFSADFPPALAGADPVIAEALKKLK